MMKRFFTACIAVSIASASYAQVKEIDDFQKKLNLYIDFNLGKIDSLPINSSNQNKLRSAVDEAFRRFVLDKNSYQYEKLAPAKGDEKTKYFRLDGRISVYAKAFPVNGKTYIVYSYTSRDKMNYVIKENESNTVVYEGNSKSYLIDALYLIDESHFLLIEKNGDRNSSRSAFVLSTKKLPWSKVKAFEGNAFGQVPGQYFVRKYVKKRVELQLSCDTPFGSDLPADANTISFDPATRTISYKQYSDQRKFKLAAAKWNNNLFVIDDYYVNENFGSSATALPE